MRPHVLKCPDRSLLQLQNELKHDNAYRADVEIQLAMKIMKASAKDTGGSGGRGAGVFFK